MQSPYAADPSAQGRSGFEVRTFECGRCGESKIIETTHPLKETQGWLTVRDLQPLE
jgi:hypothetical protein